MQWFAKLEYSYRYNVLSLLPRKDSKFYRVALEKDAEGVGGKEGEPSTSASCQKLGKESAC